MEETNYDRKTIGLVEVTDDGKSEAQAVSKDAVSSEGPPKTSKRNDNSGESDSNNSNPNRTSPWECEKKTYLQKLSLKDKPRPQRMIYRAWLSLRLLSWPVVFYAGFSYGSALIWFNVLNATASIILGGKPYKFSTGQVGLSYFACLAGVTAGSFYTGYISDWITLKLARRNHGVFEPEQRLWGFALTTIVLPASLILWGVGAAHGIHWFGLIVAMFGTAFCNASGVTLSVNYLFDSYRDLGGDGISTVIIVRNTMSFAIGYGITPWLDGLGYQNCFISAAFVGLAASSVFLIMIWKGKALRERYRLRYWALVRKHVGMGMVH